MKKTILAVFVVMVFLATAAFADAAIIKVKVTSANIRQQPDATSAVISRAAQGTFFEVIKKSGNWYEVAVTDATGRTVTGFINADVVEEVGGGAGGAAAAPAPQRGAAAPSYAAPRAAGGGASAGKFVVMAGPVFSNIAFSESVDPWKKKMRFGLAAGVGYEMPVGKDLYATGAALFSTGGCNFTYSDASGSYKQSYIGNALALRLGIKYAFNGPFVTAGPYVGFLMSPKTSWSFPGGDSGELSIDTANVNTLLFGVLLGAGYEMNLGGLKGFVQLTYNLGLSNMAKNTGGGTSTAKPNSINIIFGIQL